MLPIRSKMSMLSLLSAIIMLSGIPANSMELRIKDVATIAGLEPLELIGYGVVVGLNGTGDKDLKLTKQTMANLMENFQLSIPTTDIKSKNVAAVIITAVMPPFHYKGGRVDVQVSSIGDATSLQGGSLLMAPMLDADGRLCALAQGSVTVGGYNVGTGGLGGERVTKNIATAGLVPGGAMLQHTYSGSFHENGMLRLVLRHPDFTTASRTATAINAAFNGGALARDPATIMINIPERVLDTDQVAQFIAKLEMLTVQPDVLARVVVNERTGTIVMGNEVRIAPAVVAHGNLIVSVKSTPEISQPDAPFTGGETVVIGDTATRVQEDDARIIAIQETTTVQELAGMLNSLGATTSDLISILEALARLGALQMELVTM